ncbi:MAG: metalloregulator ArsR/SmtB family transcription factor [Planctomycetota bacterium]|nr:metalloregulator ArsR/SmtB family transcription factor [Planctomycetota bacterium]MDP6763219.1 metalloregulator ArsR/SmtB family transcription factor [Planctomycetota bacterium]MDP6990572.1 metalloregulator ArsR/SmtB family transcription factor [Planctomycetota bacterium]
MNSRPRDLRRLFRPRWFRALGDPTRLAILGRLVSLGEPSTVSETASCCGVHLSGVSRHLAVLRDAGMVTARRRGREVYYEFDRDKVTRTLRDLADALDAHDRRPSSPPPSTTDKQ